jgi:S1-C subfamily serine protease
MRRRARRWQDHRMSQTSRLAFSDQLADAVDRAAPSVVRVHGRRRPASGVVFADGLVVTTTRALGREEGLKVRTGDGRTLDAELGGWDPATGLVVLKNPSLGVAPIAASAVPPRVGHLAASATSPWRSRDRGATGSRPRRASSRSSAGRSRPVMAAASIA